jgi:hypothetical protein
MGIDGHHGWRASGLVFWRSKNRREGLVVTSAHNLPPATLMARPHFKIDGQRVAITAVVAKNEVMDTVVLQVKVPKQGLFKRLKTAVRRLFRRECKGVVEIPRPSAIANVTERTANMEVYMAGYSQQARKAVCGLRAGTTFNDLCIAHVPTREARENPKATIARHDAITSKVKEGGVPLLESYFTVEGVARRDFMPTQLSTHCGGEGFSGAPVYSAQSHEVMGIHFGNAEDGIPNVTPPGTEVSFILPAKMILRDLATKISAGKISRRFVAPIESVLKQAGVDDQVRRQWGLTD